MKRVLIIGGGFAGLSAAIRLCSNRRNFELILLDQRTEFNFLPLLPDIIGRGISSKYMAYPIKKIAQNHGFNFINAGVNKIDLEKKKVFSDNNVIAYDYLVLAAGSETNFYGNNDIKFKSYKLNDAQDGENIKFAVLSGEHDVYVVAGGGYTGVEIATNIQKLLKKKKMHKKVIIVELASNLLGPLPEWIKKYVEKNLERLKIEYRLGTSIQEIRDKDVILSDKTRLKNAMLIWSAGVKTPEIVSNLPFEKTSQGRVVVDSYLRVRNDCYVIGDSANFYHKGKPLRMAARFAIQEGRVAADNIIRDLHGKKPKRYKPFDWGYVVPMANNSACGIALGVPIKGLVGILGHYLLFFWLSYGAKNRLGLLKDLLFHAS